MSKIIKAKETIDSGIYTIPLTLFENNQIVSPGKEGSEAQLQREEISRLAESEDIVRQARAEAAQILKSTSKIAESEILRKARLEAEEIKKAAYTEGLERGEREGQNAVNQERDSILADSRAILASTLELREMIIKASEEQLIDLSLQVAENLLNTSLDVNRDLIKDIVAEALSLLAGEESILVRLNPLDLGACREQKDFFRELLTNETGIKFLPAEEVSRGSCIIQGQHTLVESLLEERFKILKSVLIKEAQNDYKTPGD